MSLGLAKKGGGQVARPTASTIRGAAVWIAIGLGGGPACVDTEGEDGAYGDASTGPSTAVCEAPALTPYAGVAVIPSAETATPGPYLWKNVVIKGGGFVSGIVSSPALPGLVFARTDVGGAYRFSPATGRWLPLTDWVGHDDSNLMGIESIATDPVDPNRVYLAAGTYLTAGNGAILVSTDMGQTWTRHEIPAPMGGNADGRSMGERLAIDPNLPSTLYFGSRTAGLWRSTDFATTWSRVGTFPTTGTTTTDTGTTGYGLSFVVFDPQSGVPGLPTAAIYVGVGATDEPSIYRSIDAGASWQAVAGAPEGMMPHHAVLDGCGNMYFTFNDKPGPNDIANGGVWRYDTTTGQWTDVSPPRVTGGFGGIAADASHPGTLLVTTIDRWAVSTGGDIYRSTDGGARWVSLMPTAQRDVAGAEWLWWHTANPKKLPGIGWMGDVEIDPFDPGRALYITGQGIWSTSDLTAADTGAPTHWRFDNDGLEETVALDLISPPAGASLLTAVGDIAGFRHDDLDTSPLSGMFDNPVFGDTTSLDFAEGVPAIVARVGTTSSSSVSRGAYSTDGGATWTPFASEPSSDASPGSIAVSADGATFLWSPRGGATSYSRDRGNTWSACEGVSGSMQVAADRVNPAKLYASGRGGTYVSVDGGVTFARANSVFGRPHPVPGFEGHVWMVTNTALYLSQDSATSFLPMPLVNGGTALGFGMPAPGQGYPSIYLAGSVSVVWGIYRTDDAGLHWQRIDDENHQFGYINCLTGDPRRHGRVYLGTGGRGILYGDPR